MSDRNKYLGKIYSPGFSCITISEYKASEYNTNLVFKFNLYDGKDAVGVQKYSSNAYQSTSLNQDGASKLRHLASRIIENDTVPIQEVFPCLGNASLTFDHIPNENGKMNTFLAVNKNKMTIPFRFVTYEQTVEEDGRMVTKVVHTGLCLLVEVIDKYLEGVRADMAWDKP